MKVTAGSRMPFPELYLAGNAHLLLLLLPRGTELTHSLVGAKPEASNRLGTHEKAVMGLTAIWRWQTDPL